MAIAKDAEVKPQPAEVRDGRLMPVEIPQIDAKGSVLDDEISAFSPEPLKGDVSLLSLNRQNTIIGDESEPALKGRAKIDMTDPNEKWYNRFLDGIVVFIAMHYVMTFWVIMLGLWTLYKYGYRLPLMLFLSVYLPWYMIPWQRMGGLPCHTFMDLPFWTRIQRFMFVQLEREVELDPNRQYIFAWHPHGIVLMSRLAIYGGLWKRMFPGINMLTLAASPLFWIPPIRDIAILLGGVDASGLYAHRLLKDGFSMSVYPGGSKEIYETWPNTLETLLVLRQRRGFIRLALQYGVPIVPVFVFGEKFAFKRLPHLTPLAKQLLRTLRVPWLIYWGRCFTQFPLPGTKICVVVGQPIEVPKIDRDKITDGLVQEVLDRYANAVVALFERHKDTYAKPGEYVKVL